MSDAQHPIPSSSSSSRPPLPTLRSDSCEQETWMNFLRTAGGTVAAESPADRKRRHVETSPERRYPPYNPFATGRRPSNTPTRTHLSHSNRYTPINFASSPGSRPLMPFADVGYNTGTREGLNTLPQRRESDMVPPPWQPDSEVSKCPVCNTEFSFWYRKHHCRKCGRVVCAACSPHRITIPRQYIVQPPTWREDNGTQLENEQYFNPALGGGEVVRVCNPCVPDPWTPNAANDEVIQGSPSIDRWLGQRGYAEPDRDAFNSLGAVNNHRADLHQFPPTDARAAHSRHQRMPSNSYPAPLTLVATHRAPAVPQPRPDGRNPGLTHPVYSIPPRITSHATVPSSYPARQVINSVVSPSSDAGPHHSSAARPHRRSTGHHAAEARRQIREEDECPVCGTEMPALPAGEAQREAHIQECIAARFSSTPAQASSLPSAPPQASPNGQQLARGSPDVQAQSRPRASSYRPRGMAVYKATEKDCSNADGEPQECVICFEEFQPGDELGRMECLCKFHRLCIRQWWETKGQGSCPTHQLHE